ncbi:MAG: hypothetical protein AAGI67_06180 [Pseudomonadota bacterium]
MVTESGLRQYRAGLRAWSSERKQSVPGGSEGTGGTPWTGGIRAPIDHQSMRDSATLPAREDADRELVQKSGAIRKKSFIAMKNNDLNQQSAILAAFVMTDFGP